MSIVVSSIATMSMNKITLWINVCADDWTVESAIIASNVNSVCVDDWTVERAIIASNVNSVCVNDHC